MRASLLLGLLAFLCGCNSLKQPVVSQPLHAVATPAVVPPVHQTVASTTRTELEAALGFEGPASGAAPRGWMTTPDGTVVVDATIMHGGHSAIRLQPTATTPDPSSAISDTVAIDFSG